MFSPLMLHLDAGRAMRVGVAVGVTLMGCHWLGLRGDAVYVAMAAQTIALPDLRGAYGMRLTILATMIAVITASAMLGMLAGSSLVFSVVVMGLIALLSGWWRHLSTDYGPVMSVHSALLFLVGLAHPCALPEALHIAGLVLMGGIGAALLQVSFWPFRPQHPLRLAVAESWVALSDLIAGMRPALAGDAVREREAIPEYERELRATLDRTFVILGAAETGHRTALLAHLEEMRREVVHLAMRVIAFHSVLDELPASPEFGRILPVIDSVLKALSDATRSTAITLIAHRPENLAASELRLRRCCDLIRVLDGQIETAKGDVHLAQVRAALARIAAALPILRARLAETMDHPIRRVSFSARLPEIRLRSIQSLAAWMNPAPQQDEVLVRYALRMALLTMLAVALYKGFEIPRGYWIAFTIIVVLQPDYGSTRQRAFQRIGGTLAGSLLGSGLIWVHLPLFVVDGCATLLAAGFAFFLKRSYGIAVFFVTLFLVLLTNMMSPLGLDFTIERLAANLLGGAAALISAVLFWPVWESEKFTALLAAAIRANGAYLESMASCEGIASPATTHTLLTAKRRAEKANGLASASLQRLLSEPDRHHDNPERAAALTTYNQRLTRALTSMAVHLQEDTAHHQGLISTAAEIICGPLETLADAIEQNFQESGVIETAAHISQLDAFLGEAQLFPPASEDEGELSRGDLLRIDLTKGITEIRAMALALERTEEI